MMLSLPALRSNSGTISFSVTILIVLLSQTLLSFDFSGQLSVPIIYFMTSRCLFIRVEQLAYVAYTHITTFIGVSMISDISTLTQTLIFSLWFFKVFKIFLVLIIYMYCLKIYCFIFDLSFIFFVLERDRFFTVYISTKETLSFNVSYKLFNKYFSLPQSSCQFKLKKKIS